MLGQIKGVGKDRDELRAIRMRLVERLRGEEKERLTLERSRRKCWDDSKRIRPQSRGDTPTEPVVEGRDTAAIDKGLE